ncbi:uncharacterized protein F5891DRAFT_1228999 [Suillus fuscotomentosus]|uniref:Uncharacterized protein n=1 Tax=Suillus fuscotomentosus TaxID=1912939 RepID=A0AAD4HKR2_9AGAM|nr:uncharacterized protein F5891DRAFT_1228999 [Suillus fuscotomentosus]KAG1900102.1 hypothetical protein F5891DRAFT_1228999 [Suillus fuscotomentosus]
MPLWLAVKGSLIVPWRRDWVESQPTRNMEIRVGRRTNTACQRLNNIMMNRRYHYLKFSPAVTILTELPGALQKPVFLSPELSSEIPATAETYHIGDLVKSCFLLVTPAALTTSIWSSWLEQCITRHMQLRLYLQDGCKYELFALHLENFTSRTSLADRTWGDTDIKVPVHIRKKKLVRGQSSFVILPDTAPSNYPLDLPVEAIVIIALASCQETLNTIHDGFIWVACGKYAGWLFCGWIFWICNASGATQYRTIMLFQKCKEDKKPSLKHSQSMPFRYSQASMFEPYADPFIAVYHGKTPSKPSNIVHVEQAPGMRDIHRAQWHPGVHDHPPSHAHFDTRAHLLDQFPSPPPPPPKPTRSASRTTSLNPQSMRPQLPPKNCNTSDQPVAGRHRTIQQSSSATYYSQPTAAAYPSLGRKKRREATADQAMADLLQTPDGRPPIFGSSRQAERARAKSSTGHSYIPIPHDLLETADGRPPVFGSSRQAERVRTKSSAVLYIHPCPL